MSWMVTRCGSGRLPDGVNVSHVLGVAMLGGMGFTMSIFIAGQSFPTPDMPDVAKAAVLVASAICGIGGSLAALCG